MQAFCEVQEWNLEARFLEIQTLQRIDLSLVERIPRRISSREMMKGEQHTSRELSQYLHQGQSVVRSLKVISKGDMARRWTNLP